MSLFAIAGIIFFASMLLGILGTEPRSVAQALVNDSNNSRIEPGDQARALRMSRRLELVGGLVQIVAGFGVIASIGLLLAAVIL